MGEEYREEEQTVSFDRDTLNVLYGYVPDHFYMGGLSFFITGIGTLISEN